jgi:hypothetical protein
MRALDHDQLLAHAATRCPPWEGAVGAAFVCDLTEPDRDEARRWRFLVSDSEGSWIYAEFVATRIGRQQRLLCEPLEEAVENELTLRYPAESRFTDLRAELEVRGGEPLRLRLEDHHRVGA